MTEKNDLKYYVREIWSAQTSERAMQISDHIEMLFAVKEEQLARVMGVLQSYQPAGSPPPGDEPILAAWILKTMRDQKEELRGEALGWRARCEELEGKLKKATEELATLYGTE
jgi:hypothetical protein